LVPNQIVVSRHGSDSGNFLAHRTLAVGWLLLFVTYGRPAAYAQLRSDLIELQRHQVELMNSPASRRVTAGLVADLAADPDLSQIYVSQYLVPRRAAVAQILQRGLDRGELAADADLDFIYDLLLGPLFIRAVVWGQPLTPEAAERSAEVVLAAFAPKSRRKTA